MDKTIFEELELEQEYDDIPEVRVSRFEKIKNFFKFRKNKDVEEYDDIPEVKVSKMEKLKAWYDSKKEVRILKREEKDLRKEEKFANKMDKMILKHDKKISKKHSRRQKREERISNIKTWYNSKKEARQANKLEKEELREQGVYTKKDLIKSFASCALQGTITCLSAAVALIGAVSAFTVGILPSLLIVTASVAAYKISNYYLQQEIESFKLKKLLYEDSVNFDKVFSEEEQNKVGFFKTLRKHFSKEKAKDDTDFVSEYEELTEEEKENNTVNIRDLIVADNANITSTKLTRDDKILKVKQECQLGRIRINDVTAYCILVAKEDVKLQKFIRKEYKKENPDENVQTFELGDKKVLMLNNRPVFK